MPTNREVIESFYRVIARRSLPEILDYLHEDVAFDVPVTLPWSQGRYRGRGSVETYIRRFLGALEGTDLAAETLVAEGDHVVVLGTVRAKARSTGRNYQARFSHLWTLREGKIIRFEGLVDTAAVRAAFD